MTSEERALDCWVTRPILPQEEFMVRHIAATIDAALAASLTLLVERFRKEAARHHEGARQGGWAERTHVAAEAAFGEAADIVEARMKEGQ